MSHNIQNSYSNIPFSEEHSKEIKSKVLSFFEALDISWVLYKSKIKTVFLSNFLLNILLSIIFLVPIGIFGAVVGFNMESFSNPNSGGFVFSLIIGVLLLVVLSVVIVFASAFLELKTIQSLNSSKDKVVLDKSNIAKELLLILIVLIITFSVSSVFEVIEYMFKASPLLIAGIEPSTETLKSINPVYSYGVLFGLMYLVFAIIKLASTIIMGIVSYFYFAIGVIENDSLAKTFSNSIGLFVNYWKQDLLRRLIFGLIIMLPSVCVILIIGSIFFFVAIGFVASQNTLGAITAFLFGLLIIIPISALIGYFFATINYVFFVNLRLLTLVDNDIPVATTIIDQEDNNSDLTSEPIVTVEQSKEPVDNA